MQEETDFTSEKRHAWQMMRVYGQVPIVIHGAVRSRFKVVLQMASAISTSMAILHWVSNLPVRRTQPTSSGLCSLFRLKLQRTERITRDRVCWYWMTQHSRSWTPNEDCIPNSYSRIKIERESGIGSMRCGTQVGWETATGRQGELRRQAGSTRASRHYWRRNTRAGKSAPHRQHRAGRRNQYRRAVGYQNTWAMET